MKTAVKISAMVAWFVVLTIGLRVDSASLPNDSIFGFLLFVLSSTTTNVGILAVCASMVSDQEMIRAIRRGFTCYLMVISGILVFSNGAGGSPEQFAKLAGTISLVCLVIGFQPEIFDSLIERIKIAVIGPKDKD